MQRVAMTWLDGLAAERGNIFAFHVPNSVNTDARTGARLKAEGVKAGVADVAIMLPGRRILFVEFKVKGRYQSKAQKEFEATCTALGHLYILCTCAHEFEVIPKLRDILASYRYTV